MDSESTKCKTRQPGGVEKGVCQVKYMDNVEEAGRGRDNAMKNCKHRLLAEKFMDIILAKN